MVRTQIQLTDDQAKRVKKLAMARGVSMAEFIRQAVDGIIHSGPAMDRGERVSRAREIVGKFSSGKSDVSRKHDAYLDSAYKP
jgi:RecA/RadA recombinase